LTSGNKYIIFYTYPYVCNDAIQRHSPNNGLKKYVEK